MQNKPKRQYGARVVTRISPTAKPRYNKSPKLAIEAFRAVSQRLHSAGRPLINAELTAVRGWEGLHDPCTLQSTSSGAVIVRREASFDDLPVISTWWGA
jgi:hypothetical protein